MSNFYLKIIIHKNIINTASDIKPFILSLLLVFFSIPKAIVANIPPTKPPICATTFILGTIKPIAKFGQFKDSIYGKGIVISNSPHSELTDDAGNRAIVASPSIDVELEKIEKSRSRKNVYGTGTAERVNIQPTVGQKCGGATSVNDNTQLINTSITPLFSFIFSILVTIYQYLSSLACTCTIFPPWLSP